MFCTISVEEVCLLKRYNLIVGWEGGGLDHKKILKISIIRNAMHITVQFVRPTLFAL